MNLQIGSVPEERRREWWAIQSTVFAFEFKDDEEEMFAAIQEWDRAWAAYAGDLMIGSAASLTFTMTVPGGADVPTAGLTAVSVLPTHRRGGALTAMIRKSFDDAHDRGDLAAVLLASETPIYGRFGYGAGTHVNDLTIKRSEAAMRAGPPITGRVRLVNADEAAAVIPNLHREATSGMAIPGSITRLDEMWKVYFYDPEHWRSGMTARMWAIYEDGDGEPRGFMRYRLKENWDDALPQYEMVAGDLHALDSEAYAALFSYCFGVDLVSTIKFYNRRVTEPIFELLADPRRVKRRMRDGIWVRLIDVPAALAARRYRVEGELVVEVQDDFCPWNEGRFLLTGGPGGAECVPTSREADLRIGASDLASAYLGDGRLAAQEWAGRVHGDPETIDRAQLMFSWGVEPWCTVDF